MTTNDLVDEHIGEALLVFQNINETLQVGWYEVTADILRCQPSMLLFVRGSSSYVRSYGYESGIRNYRTDTEM